jgi:hypothetical protein
MTEQPKLYEFTVPRGGPRRIVGVLGEKMRPETTALLNTIKLHADRFLKEASDHKESGLGPMLKRERITESSASLMKSIKQSIGTIQQRRQQLEADIRDFNPIKPYSSSKPWQAQIDLRLIDAFRELPKWQQQAIRTELQSPERFAVHLELAEAFLRLPPMLTPLTYNERQDVRRNIGRLFDPERLADIEERIAESALVQQAVRTALDVASSEIGSVGPILTEAREAWEFSRLAAPDWPREAASAPMFTPLTPAPEPAPAEDETA